MVSAFFKYVCNASLVRRHVPEPEFAQSIALELYTIPVEHLHKPPLVSASRHHGIVYFFKCRLEHPSFYHNRVDITVSHPTALSALLHLIVASILSQRLSRPRPPRRTMMGLSKFLVLSMFKHAHLHLIYFPKSALHPVPH